MSVASLGGSWTASSAPPSRSHPRPASPAPPALPPPSPSPSCTRGSIGTPHDGSRVAASQPTIPRWAVPPTPSVPSCVGPGSATSKRTLMGCSRTRCGLGRSLRHGVSLSPALVPAVPSSSRPPPSTVAMLDWDTCPSLWTGHRWGRESGWQRRWGRYEGCGTLSKPVVSSRLVVVVGWVVRRSQPHARVVEGRGARSPHPRLPRLKRPQVEVVGR